MRALILALLSLLTTTSPSSVFAQERRDGVVIVFREPQPTPVAVGLQRLRELADTVPIPDDEGVRRRLRSDLGDTLARLGELDASWRLSQRLASVPGELDADTLLEFVRRGHIAGFRHYWSVSTIDTEKRCWVLYMIATSYSATMAQDLVEGARSGLGCEITYRRDAPPRPTQPTEYDRPSGLGALHYLREHVELRWCGGYQSPCREHSLGLLFNLVGPASGEGPPELVVDLLRRVPERRVRLELVGLAAQATIKRRDARAAAVYVGQLIADLEREAPSERDQTVEWSGAGECLWEKVWSENGWVSAARASGCFGGAFGTALHLLRGGEANLARKLIAALQEYNQVVVPPDFGRGKETDSGRWAWIAVLHLAAGNTAEAESAFKRAVVATSKARDYPDGTFIWFMRHGRSDWVQRVLQHLSSVASGPDDLQRRRLAEDWARGAIVTAQVSELRAALAYVRDGIGGLSIVSDPFKVAMIMEAPYTQEIAQVVVDAFEASDIRGIKEGERIATALRMYGARTESLAVVHSLLKRQIAATEAWPGSSSQLEWAIEIVLKSDPQFQPLELLSLAPTRERYAAHLMVVASIEAFRRNFKELARIGPLIDRLSSDIDRDEFETQRAWRDIAYAYAAKGDLAKALDMRGDANIRLLSDGLYTAFVKAWAKAIGLGLQ